MWYLLVIITIIVIKNDTEKAFEMIKQGGIVLWHDYVPFKKSCKDVVKLIEEISFFLRYFIRNFT